MKKFTSSPKILKKKSTPEQFKKTYFVLELY